MSDAKLLQDVKKQVEFYFSDAAFRRDNFLKAAVANDPQGFVPIATLLTFNKLKQLTTDAKVVAEALKDSETIVVSEDNLKLKRVEPLPEVDDSSLRTLYVKGYPRDESEVTIDTIREQFSVYGPINYVKLRRETGSHTFKGSCFIEFSKEEDMQKAYQAANEGGSVKIGHKGTPFLCVIPFNEWQANHNAKISGSKRSRQNANESKESEDHAEGDDEQAEKSSYQKGLLLEIENLPADFPPKSLREFLSKHAEVAFVEKSADNKVIVRLRTAEETKKLQDAIKAGLSFPEDSTVKLGAMEVSEEAEKAFYDRLKESAENSHGRNNNRKGGRGGGYHGKRQRR